MSELDASECGKKNHLEWDEIDKLIFDVDQVVRKTKYIKMQSNDYINRLLI